MKRKISYPELDTPSFNSSRTSVFKYTFVKALLDLDLIHQPFALLYFPALADGPKGALAEALELGLSPEVLYNSLVGPKTTYMSFSPAIP